jgi:hypothetical protein
MPIWLPLAVSAGAVACTLLIHALALRVTVGFVRREIRLARAGRGFWIDVGIVGAALFVLFVAHLAEVASWAVLFVLCGEFSELGPAYYHSAVNYTTLGYGDVIMSPAWRLLGPLEAAVGMLMFGVSTAIVFGIIQRLLQTRFVELR